MVAKTQPQSGEPYAEEGAAFTPVAEGSEREPFADRPFLNDNPQDEVMGLPADDPPKKRVSGSPNDSASDDSEKPLFSGAETEKPDPKKRQMVSLLGIFRYADGLDRALIIVGLVLACASGGGMPALSVAFGQIMDDLISMEDPEGSAASTALIFTYIAIAMFFAYGGFVLCFTISAARQVSRIRLCFFQACLRQDIGWHDVHSPGELTARMTGDTRVVQNGINDKIAQGVMFLAMSVAGFIIGFVYCWELTLVMLGMMPFIAFMAAMIGKYMGKMAESSRKHFAAAGSIATEVMENVRTVQTFGKEEYETERFHNAVLDAQKHGIHKEIMTHLSAAVIMFLIYINYCISFFFGSYLVQWGRHDMNNIVVAFFAVLNGSIGLGLVSPSYSAFIEARVSAFEIFKAIDRVPDIDITDDGGTPVTGFRDAIEFQHVKFAYPTRPDMVLFRDLNLTIKKGQKVAFSGASGCGKSSMIGLLQRFYDPVDGQVLCDGVDMRSLNLKQWRDQIGIVSQEPNLFAGSMIENVRIGKQDATEEEVVAACKQANIHDTIMGLPDGYDTPVGSVGSQLSGGQKQRIAIARALVKKPSILLLDEATSALDRKSEAEVQAALDELMHAGNVTVIIVAHRLTTIRDVDCIHYVKFDGIEGSKITESGSFDELMALNGEFAVMAKTQGVTVAEERKDGDDKNNATRQGSVNLAERDINVILDEEELARLEEEAPRTERQRVPIEELAKWEVKRTNAGFCRIMSYSRDKTWCIVLGVLGSIIIGVSRPTGSILFGSAFAVLGEYKYNKDDHALRSGINLYAPMYILFGVAVLVGWLLYGMFGVAGEHLTTRIRTLLFRQILRQDMSFFDIPGRDAGTLAGMLSGDCEAVHQLYGPSIGTKVQMVCTVLGGVVVAFIFQWKLALIGLACLPIVFGAALVENVVMRQYTQSKEGDMDDTIVTEAFSNIRTATSFNLQENRFHAYQEVVAAEGPRAIKRGIVAGLAYGATQFVFYAVWALAFWYGGKLIAKGEADFREVVVSSMAVLMGAMSGGEAGSFATKLVDAQKATKRVFSIIDREPDIDVYGRGDCDLGSGCGIEFQKVQFIYPARPKQVVLASVNLSFNDGTLNGLMGQTGCGKSTIIQMLARFYEKRSGRIMMNGKELSSIDIREWRKNISIVLQEPNLFSGTVRENIRYAREDATDEEIEEAAKLAHIHHEIIKWPEGYDTDVGYKGRSLSGGQKQRVAIARGLLRRPKLLLLDEATSALDNVTESAVQQGIDAFQQKHHVTTVSIAHRLTTIRHSDQIILLDAGQICERGNHDQLMALGGEYKVRWELYNSASR